MWATQYIELLKSGVGVKFRPHGNSMQPRIESGELVTVEPIGTRSINVGDVVLCKVEGKQWLHLVTAIASDGRYQISNNKGHVNGWCMSSNIFGIVTAVEK
jgi:phage repressor protein C with HTH and peptisase S24 domain